MKQMRNEIGKSARHEKGLWFTVISERLVAE
jgi:hypothetical protein